MLRNKLNRLEKAVKVRADKSTINLVLIDEKRDRMKIESLDFDGSVHDGEALIDKYHGGVFVLMSFPDAYDVDDVSKWYK